MIRQAPEKIQALIEPVVVGLGYEYVGAELLHQGRHSLLRIYIDTVDGVTVDDCARVSRQVSGVLDVEDPLPGQYVLEVSSPGLDRLLFRPKQFEQFIGENVQLKLETMLDGRRRLSGELLRLEDGVVVLSVEGQEMRVPFMDIEQARLKPRP